MDKITLLWLLSGLCLAAGQHKYVASSSRNKYISQSKEESNHYEINHYEYEHKPYPYRFGYDIRDEKGNKQYHNEEGDEHNVKKGSYGFTDAHGIYRQVDYIADHMGFRAKIRTNEPGTASYHPAHVSIYSEQPPSHIHSYENPVHPKYEAGAQPAYGHPEEVQYDDSANDVYEHAVTTGQQKADQPKYGKHIHVDYTKPIVVQLEKPSVDQNSKYDEQGYADPGYNEVGHQPNLRDHGQDMLNHKYHYVPVYLPHNSK